MTESPSPYSPKGCVKEQPIEMIKHMLGDEDSKSYCLVNLLKDIPRFEGKDGENGLGNAVTYTDFLRYLYSIEFLRYT